VAKIIGGRNFWKNVKVPKVFSGSGKYFWGFEK
jgi:hypothetical protein